MHTEVDIQHILIQLLQLAKCYVIIFLLVRDVTCPYVTLISFGRRRALGL